MAEYGNQQEAHGRQDCTRFTERAHSQQRGWAVDDDACGFQADQPEEQAHSRTHGKAQAHGDAVKQPFADLRQAHDHKEHAGDKHRAEGNLPAIAHFADNGVGEEGIQTHARCQADWPVGVQTHQETADGRADAGGDKRGAMIDASRGHDVGVNEDDVSHGDESRQARQQLGFDCGAVFGQLEEAVKQTGFDQVLHLRRLLFLFSAFHRGTPHLLLCATQSLCCALLDS